VAISLPPCENGCSTGEKAGNWYPRPFLFPKRICGVIPVPVRVRFNLLYSSGLPQDYYFLKNVKKVVEKRGIIGVTKGIYEDAG